MPKVVLVSVFSLIVGLSSLSYGQTRDIFWHFGSNANSIEFTRPDLQPQEITLPNALGTGGGASAADYLNGELLFYTDGVNVYDANDVQIATITGSTTRNQGAVVSLNPADAADTSEYYIFHVDNGGQIRYTIYDKAIFRTNTFPLPPEGDIDPAITNLTSPNLPANVLSEGMIIIANQDRTGFWLITHDQGTSNYNVTQVDATGLNTTTYNLPGAPTDVANFSYSPVTNQLAVSPNNAAENITLLDIDLTTGDVTLSGIDLSTVPNDAIYDTEWSSNGSFLYASGDYGTNDLILRVDLTQTPIVFDTVSTNINFVNSYGLQYGADTAIYHLYENGAGRFIVGRIEAPNEPDINQISYNRNPLGNTDFAGQQFPSFLPPINLLNIDFTFSGTCANAPTFFFPQVSPDFEAIQWDFLGDGNFVPLTGGSFNYTAAGTYDVTMRVFMGGAVETVTQQVTIDEFDLTLQIDPQRQYWCTQDFGDRMDPSTSIVTYTATAQGNNAQGAIIRWSNQTAAQANATTTFVEPGTYYVVATDPTTGCETYQEQQVFEYGVQNNYAFVWYFGEHAGLDFNPLFDLQNPGPITPIDFGGTAFNGGNDMVSPEGCAIYCDANGDPLLYSDGQEVYNRAGTELTTDLGGNEDATQSIFIVQNPADATLYYLFFTQTVPGDGTGNYNFNYAIFDLKMLNGDGDLVRDTGGNPIITTLYSNSTERITGNANWVITHEYGNDIFRAYPINGQGIGAPVFSNAGQTHTTTLTSAKGYMKLSADKLAVALSISNSENYVDLFDFDVATGAITPVVTLDFPQNGRVYGVEFSPDNQKLYSTLWDLTGGSSIHRWVIDTTTVNGQVTDTQFIQDSDSIIANETTILMGALQQGPQGSIYVAKDGATTLASIDDPDNVQDPQFNLITGDFANLGSDLVNGGQNNSRLGLPNFVDFSGSTTPSPSLSVFNGCQGDPLVFTVLNPLPDAEVESYVVQIYNSNNNVIAQSPTLSVDNPVWNFTQTQTPGNYEAQLFILNTCGLAQASDPRQPFVINPNPTIGTITPVAPPDCGLDGSVIIEFTANATQSYTISGPASVPSTTVTGPTTETVNNLPVGFYTLTVSQTYTTGTCTSTFNFSIEDDTDYEFNAFESDQADCNGENGEITFELVNGPLPASYQYDLVPVTGTTSLNGNDTQAQVVLSPIDSGSYYVRLLDSDGCTSIDTVDVTTPPELTLTIGDIPSSCDGEPILIDIQVDALAQSLVTVNELNPDGTIGNEISDALYDVIGANDTLVINRPPNIQDQAIEYVVVVPGELNGPCPTAQLITVDFGSSDPSPFPSALSFCGFEENPELNQVVLSNNLSGFTDISWFDNNGNEISSTGDDYVFENDSIKIRTQGRITAELTNVFGCVTVAEINIIEDCKARINAPSAFRPSSAIPANQTWTIFPFLVANEDFEIFIYNRWGELIFQSDDLNFMVTTGWNGGYGNDPGRPVQGGSFAYKVQFKSSFEQGDAEIQERRGGITLIR